MIENPLDQLLRKMAEFDLNPKTILWDGRTHRFPGARKKRGSDGWYVAYPDRRGAWFGDWSTGVKEHWKLGRQNPPTEGERRKWAAEREQRAKEQAKARRTALEQIQKLWNAARTPEPKKEPHPYLLNKEIHEYPNLRISTLTTVAKDWKVPSGLLLVPMYKGGRLINVQRIWPNGKKRPWPAAELIGARHVFGIKNGQPEAGPDAPYYISESWATSYSIWRATNCPVICAFSAGGLLSIAQELRDKRDPERIIIAADNDRWSVIRRGGKLSDIPNPGVHYATEAAKAVNGEVAIPDFEDLEGKPTDFDDLRLAEGMDAVRRWLAPEMAGNAVTLPETVGDDESDDEETEGKTEKDKWLAENRPEWKGRAPFRCLGHDNGTYFFAAEQTGQIRALTESELGRSRPYYALGPRPWWCYHFKHKSVVGFHLEDASWALMQECIKEGVFHAGRYRGRGAWRTEDGYVVLHLGDRLLAPGAEKYTFPESFQDGNRIYPRLGRLAGPAMKIPMEVEEATRIYDLFNDLPWEDESSGALLAGWMVIAPFCGALPYRPHAWVTGPTECGKSTIFNRIIAPMLSGISAIQREAHMTSEAAMRQLLASDALPILLDEADMVGKRAKMNLRGLFNLARSASTGGTVSKGSTGGVATDFTVRSMFLYASTVVGLELDQDKNRVAILPLRNPKNEDLVKRQERWVQVQRQIIDLISPQHGRRLMARTATWLRDGRFDELFKVCQKASLAVMKTARAGELYGALIAGSWMLRSDKVPPAEEVVAWIKDSGLGGTQEEEQGAKQTATCLSLLLQSREVVLLNHVKTALPIGVLIDRLAGQSQDLKVDRADAEQCLRHCGLMVKDGNFLIANQSEWVTRKFKDTPFEAGWMRVLRSLPKATAGDHVRFYPGMKSRVTVIPLESLSVSTLF